jgi:hypothetical protein
MAAPPATPPQVGVPVSKASLDAKWGGAVSSYKKAVVQMADEYDWATAYTAQDLVDLYGYTIEEANLFKSALGEVPALRDQLQALVFIPKCWGA